MPQVFSSIMGALKSPAMGNVAKVAQPVMGGLGVVSNLIQGNRASSVQQNAINQQKQLMALVNDPAAFSAKIKSLQQPLSQGLTQGVGNGVQGYLAERGLSSSPQISEEVMAQALGPFQQNEQQMAIQSLLSAYGLGQGATGQAVGASPGQIDTSGFWKMLQERGNVPAANPAPTASSIPWPKGLEIPDGLPPMGSSGSNYPGTTDYEF